MIRLLALMVAYLLSGCVSIRTHERGEIEVKRAAYEDCIGIIEEYAPRSAKHLLEAKIRTLEQRDNTLLIEMESQK